MYCFRLYTIKYIYLILFMYILTTANVASTCFNSLLLMNPTCRNHFCKSGARSTWYSPPWRCKTTCCAVVQTNETTRINRGSPCTWVAPCCSCSSAAVQPTTPWCHLKRNWYEWIFIGAKICKALNAFTVTYFLTMFSNQDSKVFYRIPSPQLLGCSHLSRFCGEANCHLGHGHGSTGMAGSVAKWGLCSPVSPFVDAWLVGRGQEKGSSKPGSNGSIVVAIRQNLCALLIWTCWTIRTFEANVPSNSFWPGF